jgi:hypothetical protein
MDRTTGVYYEREYTTKGLKELYIDN